MLSELISAEQDPSLLATFSSAVSSRWILLFCGPNLDPVTVTLGLRIFTRMWETRGAFSGAASQNGFMLLSKLLSSYHDIRPIYFAILAVLFGKNLDDIPSDTNFDHASLLAIFKPNELKTKGEMSAEAVFIIIGFLKASSTFILKCSKGSGALNHVTVLSKVSWSRKFFFSISTHDKVESSSMLQKMMTSIWNLLFKIVKPWLISCHQCTRR